MAPSPQAFPEFARIHCLLQDRACATLFVETSRFQVKFSRFWAPCQPAICAQISGTIAQISAIARKQTFLGRRCPEAPELPAKGSILSQVWSVEAAPIRFNLEAVFGFLGISKLSLFLLSIKLACQKAWLSQTTPNRQAKRTQVPWIIQASSGRQGAYLSLS